MYGGAPYYFLFFTIKEQRNIKLQYKYKNTKEQRNIPFLEYMQ